MNILKVSTRTRRPFIKVCGQTYTGSVDCSTAFGAEYIGFNFCLGSSSYVSPAHAAGMRTANVLRVGVFSQHSTAEICHIMQAARLHLAQLHGELTQADAAVIGTERVIRVVRIQPGASADSVQEELDAWAPFCRCYLVECKEAAVLTKVNFPHPWILSGRMTAGELQNMLSLCRPDGVDLDSSMAAFPGIGCAKHLLAAMNAVAV